TVQDLNLFLQTIFAGKWLTEKSLTAIKAPYRLGFPHPWLTPSYGPGFLGDVASPIGSLLGHNGGGPGWSISTYCLDSGKRLIQASVVRTSDDGPDAESWLFKFLDAPSPEARHL